MTPGKEALLILARSGMELSWRYAWVGFLMLSIYQRVFPLAETAAAFAMAIGLNHLSANRNWRLYQGLLLEAAGIVFVTLLFVYRLWFETVSFFSFTWVGVFFRDPWSLSQTFMLILMLFCLLVIWRGGRALVTHPMDYDTICIQFDKGLGFFILLLLVKFLIQEKTGTLVHGLALGFLVGAFFIFSLLSIFLARKQNDVEKAFMTGYHGIGITLSLTSIMILLGSGATFFFYPILTQVADSSLVLVKGITEPLIPALIAILLFFFSPRNIRLGSEIESNTPELPDDLVNAPVSDWVVSLLHSVSLGVSVVIGIVALILVGLFIRHLIRLLMRKNTANNVPGRSLSWIVDLIRRLLLLPMRVWQALCARLKGVESATWIYIGLLRWGKRSGLRLGPGETPAEYGNRLVQHFPALGDDITSIVEAFNREIYGQITIDPKTIARLLSARRHLRRFRHWPSRIQKGFFQ